MARANRTADTTGALHPSCPGCYSASDPLVWHVHTTGERTYKCVDCGKQWTVNGTQETLFDLGAAPMQLTLMGDAQ